MASFGREVAAAAKRRVAKWLVTIALLAAAVLAVYLLRGRIAAALTVHFPSITLPQSWQDAMPDSVMGYNSVDFTQAVLGEAHEKQSLVVYEQDVSVSSTISNSLANISWFTKTKTIHSYGTGVYTVDLSGMDAECVAVDLEKQTVTVTVPPAALDYVTVDDSKTTFEDTEHAIFAFGDIKLTQEQQNELDKAIDDAMRAELAKTEVLQAADKAAVQKVQALLEPVVHGVAPEYAVRVEMAAR